MITGYRYKEMQAEWKSWEHLLREDFKRIETRLQKCYDGMQRCGVGREDREQFVLGKIQEMIMQVAEG